MSLTERYAAAFPRSRRLHEQARGLFPDGVTHDLRHLEPFPVYLDRAQGARKWDVDGHELIDYWAGHGALLLGHGHPAVVAAVRRQMERGTHPGGCHEGEVEWGRWVQRLVPSAERVRFVSSGTEATLMALRLARLFTGRPRVLKFAGHFHGWHDFLVHQADAPFDGRPTPGVPPEVARETVVVPPNDIGLVERTLRDDPSIDRAFFTDGIVRPVFRDDGGHQYVIDRDGHTRCYGAWLPELDEVDGPLVVLAPEAPSRPRA